MLFFLLVMLLISVAWVYQFAFLMSLSDEELGVRYDKILWCAAFILLPIVAPFAFKIWRTARLRAATESR
jgi:hypothetical protein